MPSSTPAGTVEVPLLPEADVTEPAIRRAREQTRGALAKTLLYTYLVLVGSILLLVGIHTVTLDDANSLLAPLPTLLGTALGFYFGRQGSDEERSTTP